MTPAANRHRLKRFALDILGFHTTIRFARDRDHEFGAGVETAHLDRGIHLPRECAKYAHPESWCGAELEILRKPPAFVADRKLDRVIGTTSDANPDISTLIAVISVFGRVYYQLAGDEGDRNCPIGHDIDARLGRDLDVADRYGVTQILANVPDIDAEIDPSGPLP